MTALATTRKEVRRRIGRRLSDVTQLTATANGSTTTFVDTTKLATSIENAKGREVVFTSGTNAGLVRRVTDANMTTGTLTFAAVTASTVAGDTAELYNFRLKGWTVDEYNDAINDAIDTAWPLFATKVSVNAAATFDADSGEIDIPSGIDQVESVEYQDSSGIWHEITQAASRYDAGWSVAHDGTTLHVRGRRWLNGVSGLTVRLNGYARSGRLDSDTATTDIPPEWLEYAACEILCLSARERDANNYNLALLFREKAEKARESIRTRRRGRPVMVTP